LFKPPPLLKIVLAQLGVFAIAANVTGGYRAVYVVHFFAGDVRFVEWDHG
jgi:hypothetical protein